MIYVFVHSALMERDLVIILSPVPSVQNERKRKSDELRNDFGQHGVAQLNSSLEGGQFSLVNVAIIWASITNVAPSETI